MPFEDVLELRRQGAVDLLVVGSGTGMAAALAGAERGLKVLIAEVGIRRRIHGPVRRRAVAACEPILDENDAGDTMAQARTYLDSVVVATEDLHDCSQ
jgi:thioredoxin reductase